MSTSSSLPPPTPPSTTLPPLAPPTRNEITLVSHSMLFYWWPIWVLGYIFAIWTYYENHRLAIVPENSQVVLLQETARNIKEGELTYRLVTDPTEINRLEKEGNKEGEITYRLTVHKPTTKSLESAVSTTNSTGIDSFRPHISQRPWMGPIFCVVLLITVVITNVPLRGLWSFLVILILVVLVLLVTILHKWDDLLAALFNLHIFINMAGYLFIATAVFILWAVSVFIFDQRTYMTVEPGQVRICEHIGASIRNIDATGIEFEKQRDDLFRHWLLGFFSGDLIIHLPDKQQIRLPNVLGIGWRIETAQTLLREKAVTPHA